MLCPNHLSENYSKLEQGRAVNVWGSEFRKNFTLRYMMRIISTSNVFVPIQKHCSASKMGTPYKHLLLPQRKMSLNREYAQNMHLKGLK